MSVLSIQSPNPQVFETYKVRLCEIFVSGKCDRITFKQLLEAAAKDEDPFDHISWRWEDGSNPNFLMASVDPLATHTASFVFEHGLVDLERTVKRSFFLELHSSNEWDDESGWEENTEDLNSGLAFNPFTIESEVCWSRFLESAKVEYDPASCVIQCLTAAMTPAEWQRRAQGTYTSKKEQAALAIQKLFSGEAITELDQLALG